LGENLKGECPQVVQRKGRGKPTFGLNPFTLSKDISKMTVRDMMEKKRMSRKGETIFG